MRNTPHVPFDRGEKTVSRDVTNAKRGARCSVVGCDVPRVVIECRELRAQLEDGLLEIDDRAEQVRVVAPSQLGEHRLGLIQQRNKPRPLRLHASDPSKSAASQRDAATATGYHGALCAFSENDSNATTGTRPKRSSPERRSAEESEVPADR